MTAKRSKKQDPAWVRSLRLSLAGECGEGWKVRDIRGRVQLTVWFDNDDRASVMLGSKARTSSSYIPWAGSSTRSVLNLCVGIKRLMEQGQDLRDAHDCLIKAEGTKDALGALDWSVISERFKKWKLSSGEIPERTWVETYRSPIGQAVAVLNSKPGPMNSKGVFQE